MKDQKKTCPSATATEGADLIGIVNAQGTVDLLGTPFPVTQDFIEESSNGRPAEQRFRFASRCIQSGCNQWKEGKCSVIKNVLDALPVPASDLQPCAIRSTCRWYFQEGRHACAVCPLIVTDNEPQQDQSLYVTLHNDQEKRQ